MSSDRVYLTREEQIFLMEMFETDNIERAAERFIELMISEGANPNDFNKYLKKIVRKMK